MIKLTDTRGKAHYLSPEHVTDIFEGPKGEGAAVLRVHDATPDTTPLVVTESPEEVVRKIMEYRLAMVRYKSSSDVFESAETGSEKIGEAAEGKADVKNILKHLAGLEDSRDA